MRRLVEHLQFSFIYYCLDLDDPPQINNKLCNRSFEPLMILLTYDKSQSKHFKSDESLSKMIYIISTTASCLKKLFQIKPIPFTRSDCLIHCLCRNFITWTLVFFLLLAISMKNTTSTIFKEATHSRQFLCFFYLLSRFDQRTALEIIKTIQKKNEGLIAKLKAVLVKLQGWDCIFSLLWILATLRTWFGSFWL